MSEWKEYGLADVYDFASGLSKSADQFGFGSEFVSFKDVFQNFFLPQKLNSLVNSSDKEQKSCSVMKGDVFLTRTSETQEELGMSAVALKDYPKATFNGFAKRLRPKGTITILPEYAGYYFRSKKFRDEVTSMASMTTRASLNNGMLSALRIVVPPIEVQKRIGSSLKALDDKIDLLHRQNATLEKMAETLFRQWFVERSLSEAEGEAKEEWEVGKLGEILSVKGGTTPSTKESNYWDGNIHWTSPRDVTNLNGIYMFDTERKITESGLSKISSGLLPKGTLLMTSRAPVGVLAFSEIPVAINQGYIAVIDDKGFSKEFIYLWLKTNMDYVQSYSNGSTFLEISKSAFKSLDIMLPPEGIRDEFQAVIKPLFNKIKSNQIQILTLTALRDTLLPKLMSGEVRVSEL